MKKLVLYYSFEGNTKCVAEKLALELGADIKQLEPLNELNSKGFYKYVWGGRQAVMKTKPEIKPLDINIEEYDMVIFGTPVWASTFAPPVRTVMDQLSFKNHKVALFYCHDGGPGKIEERFKSEVTSAKLLATHAFLKPLKSGGTEVMKEVRKFIEKLS